MRGPASTAPIFTSEALFERTLFSGSKFFLNAFIASGGAVAEDTSSGLFAGGGNLGYQIGSVWLVGTGERRIAPASGTQEWVLRIGTRKVFGTQ